jgi:RNA polymerase sigma factor (sigma-70 family)
MQVDLATQSIPIAERIANRYAKRLPSIADEIRSTAMLSLVESVSRLPVDKISPEEWTARLNGYVASDIAAYLNSTGQNDMRRNHVSIDSVDEEVFASEETRDIATQIGYSFEELIEKLPDPRDRAVCRYLYVEGLTNKQTAERMNVSMRAIQYAKATALSELREIMKGVLS